MSCIRKGIGGMALLLAAQGAWAQSTLTSYGVADVFLQYQGNRSTHSFSERSGGNSGSSFGLKGDEDLGNDLKAKFVLESGYNINNGTFFVDSSSLFYRQAWVGLTHAEYGSLTASPLPRHSRSRRPIGNLFDVSVTYTGGALFAGLAYQNQHAGSEALPGLSAPLNLLGTERFTGAIAYRLGMVNLQANYTYNRSRDATAGSVAAQLGASHSYSFAEVGATIQATAADTVQIAGIERSARGVHDKGEGVQIGIDHSISKRTQIYARGGYIKNQGSSTMSWPAVSVTELGSSQRLVALGVTHRF